MKVLDLYACEGGAGWGYHLAGATVVMGVDDKLQPRYPKGLLFMQADVLSLTVEFIRRFDFVHASPPCQFVSELTPPDKRANHVNLIPQTRELLQAAGVPFAIENVRKARPHLIRPVSLTGTMFNNHFVTSAGRRYVLERERLFETGFWDLVAPPDPGPCGHPIAGIYGGHLRCRDKAHRTGKGTGRTMDFIGEDKSALARQLMGMPWATMNGMSEAIPPSYTHFIGRQFQAYLRKAA